MANRLKQQGENNILKLLKDNNGQYLDFNGFRIYQMTKSLTHNTTSTTTNGDQAPEGSIGFTTNATGKGKTWFAGATTWQAVTSA